MQDILPIKIMDTPAIWAPLQMAPCWLSNTFEPKWQQRGAWRQPTSTLRMFYFQVKDFQDPWFEWVQPGWWKAVMNKNTLNQLHITPNSRWSQGWTGCELLSSLCSVWLISRRASHLSHLPGLANHPGQDPRPWRVSTTAWYLRGTRAST